MDATLAFPLLVALIAIALFFDFLNGLHDAANSIATIVSTRVLRPQYAVFWAAFFNFIAFLFFGLHVAETLGKGIIDPSDRHARGDFCSADGRDHLEHRDLDLRHPVQFVPRARRRSGRGRAGKTGVDAIVWTGLLKTVGAIFMSPMIGFFLALVAGPDRFLAVCAPDPVCSRSNLPRDAVCLGLALFARPWRQ